MEATPWKNILHLFISSYGKGQDSLSQQVANVSVIVLFSLLEVRGPRLTRIARVPLVPLNPNCHRKIMYSMGYQEIDYLDGELYQNYPEHEKRYADEMGSE